MKPIVLASSSPRRKKILDEARIPYIVDPADLDEQIHANETPLEAVIRLALLKARKIAEKHVGSIILGADTVVSFRGIILGKPKHNDDARRMLRLLSGTVHNVITGVAIVNTENRSEYTGYDKTRVYLKSLSDKEIDTYIRSGEAMDKAGAYAVQEGLSQSFVQKTEGDFTNVVGLPIAIVKRLLKKSGYLFHN